MTAAPDVFLSYNREDAAVAKLYADAFSREGLEVWWDQTLRSGETYDEVTEAALRGAKAVVVLWSPRSVASHWVRAEATIAHRAKTLIPATIESCDKPVMFELTQTAELSHWRGEAGDAAWQGFLGDVKRMTGNKSAGSVQVKPDPIQASSGGGVPFVGVLPITHRDNDAKLELLAEDLTEEITRELTQSSLFKVVSARTMSAWRYKAADYRAMHAELGAAYVIESKLQHAGEEVRLTMQVVDAVTGGMLKSMRHARRLDELEHAPEELPLVAASALTEEIEQAEMSQAMARSGHLSGWDHLLRALAYTRRAGSDSTARATVEARLAVEQLPDLGLAHALLAHMLAVPAGSLGLEISAEEIYEIRLHGRRAMQLDGDNPAVFAQLMTSYAAIGDLDSGLQLAQRAVELSPHSPDSLFWLAMALAGSGRPAEALGVLTEYDRLSRQHRLQPVALWTRGICHFLLEDTVEAAVAIDRSLAINPDFGVALKWKAIVAAHRGDEPLARATVRRLKEVEPSSTLENHIWQMVRIKKLGELSSEAIATFRRLWAECEDDG